MPHRRSTKVAAIGALISALVFASCGGEGGSGGDGETHAIGEEVAVGHNQSTESGARGPSTTIGLTVLGVRQGTQEELTEGGFEVDPEDQNTIPYYVDARYENQGEETVERNLDVNLEDADGNLINGTLIFNFGSIVFEPCPAVTDGKFKPGDSYESCTLFLVNPGVEVATVSFLSDEGEGVPPEFVYWDIE